MDMRTEEINVNLVCRWSCQAHQVCLILIRYHHYERKHDIVGGRTDSTVYTVPLINTHIGPQDTIGCDMPRMLFCAPSKFVWLYCVYFDAILALRINRWIEDGTIAPPVSTGLAMTNSL